MRAWTLAAGNRLPRLPPPCHLLSQPLHQSLPMVGRPVAVVRRVGWLHFFNDLTLDFLTPLLPAGVSAAWIGLMEGLADGVGQVLKLITGRASDASGRRAGWVRLGYGVNAFARPLAGVGMLLLWPWWVLACRVADRVGKGLRGSATDALVSDWTSDGERARVFGRLRMMDHLGATIGALAAALVAATVPAAQIGWYVCALAPVALVVVWLGRGLRDAPADSPVPGTRTTPGWWPEHAAPRRALEAIAIAGLASRLSPFVGAGDGGRAADTGGRRRVAVVAGVPGLGGVRRGTKHGRTRHRSSERSFQCAYGAARRLAAAGAGLRADRRER